MDFFRDVIQFTGLLVESLFFGLYYGLIIGAAMLLVTIAFYGSIGLVLLLYHYVPKFPGFIRRLAAYLGQQWTMPSWRFGWQSFKDYADSQTPLLSDSSNECLPTSRLCVNCYHWVQKSRLLSGSLLPFVPRREWHNWTIPFQNTNANHACHLCRILWFLAPEVTRAQITSYCQRDPPTEVNGWISICKGEKDSYIVEVFYHVSGSLKLDKLSGPILVAKGRVKSPRLCPSIAALTIPRKAILPSPVNPRREFYRLGILHGSCKVVDLRLRHKSRTSLPRWAST
jgi:hypothetical protein